MAPGKTPAPIVELIATAVQRITKEKPFIDKVTDIGALPIGDTPEQFRAFVQSEMRRWAKIVKDAGIKLE
jgi:tripartite-type tricarboxylate transporter receptor subunit TctC